MKENDMLAFEAWLNDNWDPKTDPVVRCAQSAWEAACQYRQKEIDELKQVNYDLVKSNISTYSKLQAENAKLRELTNIYSDETEFALNELIKEIRFFKYKFKALGKA